MRRMIDVPKGSVQTGPVFTHWDLHEQVQGMVHVMVATSYSKLIESEYDADVTSGAVLHMENHVT